MDLILSEVNHLDWDPFSVEEDLDSLCGSGHIVCTARQESHSVLIKPVHVEFGLNDKTYISNRKLESRTYKVGLLILT